MPTDEQRLICERISAWFRGRDADWIKAFKPNYFTSEAANARLLDELIKHDRDRGAGIGWITPPLIERLIRTSEDRKTAVVLAFCKFAGIDL